jgi:hypothetical protein
MRTVCGVGRSLFREQKLPKLQKSPSRLQPKGWPLVSPAEITTLVTSGLTPKGREQAYAERCLYFIRSQNVLMNRLDLSNAACVPPEVHASISRTFVHDGAVILNITGPSIGCVARKSPSHPSPSDVHFRSGSRRYGRSRTGRRRAGGGWTTPVRRAAGPRLQRRALNPKKLDWGARPSSGLLPNPLFPDEMSGLRRPAKQSGWVNHGQPKQLLKLDRRLSD